MILEGEAGGSEDTNFKSKVLYVLFGKLSTFQGGVSGLRFCLFYLVNFLHFSNSYLKRIYNGENQI